MPRPNLLHVCRLLQEALEDLLRLMNYVEIPKLVLPLYTPLPRSNNDSLWQYLWVEVAKEPALTCEGLNLPLRLPPPTCGTRQIVYNR